MSLSWPDTLRICLFSDRSWIARRNGRIVMAWSVPSTPGVAVGNALIDALERELASDVYVKPSHARKVRVVVSDACATQVTVPWEEVLTRTEERNAYAHARFDAAGSPLDESWVMHAEFCRHRSTGLAYAIRAAWLERLRAVLARHALELESVLPVSACAYLSQRRLLPPREQIILLHERERITALSIGRNGLQDLDMEAVIGSPAASRARLLARLGAVGEKNRIMVQWQANERESEVGSVPEADAGERWLASDQWSRII